MHACVWPCARAAARGAMRALARVYPSHLVTTPLRTCAVLPNRQVLGLAARLPAHVLRQNCGQQAQGRGRDRVNGVEPSPASSCRARGARGRSAAPNGWVASTHPHPLEPTPLSARAGVQGRAAESGASCCSPEVLVRGPKRPHGTAAEGAEQEAHGASTVRRCALSWAAWCRAAWPKCENASKEMGATAPTATESN